jgi:uncharacterized protein
MSRIALLDVNVLVALFDPAHVHHDIAHAWFADNRDHGWATCPLTENGFLRTANVGRREFVPVPELVDHLDTFRSTHGHHFWVDDLSLVDRRLFNASVMHGRRQLTDIYLLGLAVKQQARLVTLDQRIPLAAVKGAQAENLVVLSPSE